MPHPSALTTAAQALLHGIAALLLLFGPLSAPVTAVTDALGLDEVELEAADEEPDGEEGEADPSDGPDPGEALLPPAVVACAGWQGRVLGACSVPPPATPAIERLPGLSGRPRGPPRV